jgi:hypothetical protein
MKSTVKRPSYVDPNKEDNTWFCKEYSNTMSSGGATIDRKINSTGGEEFIIFET